MINKLILASLLVTSFSHNSNAQEDIQTEPCFKTYFDHGISQEHQISCLKEIIEKDEITRTQEESEFLRKLLNYIESEKLPHLLPIINEYATNNNIEAEAYKDTEEVKKLIQGILSKNSTILRQSLVTASTKYLEIKAIRQAIYHVVHNSFDIQSQQIALDFFFQLQGNNPIHNFLKTRSKALEYAKNINAPITIRKNALSFLKRTNHEEYLAVIINNIEVDDLYIDYMLKEFSNRDIYAKALELLKEDIIKFELLIPKIFEFGEKTHYTDLANKLLIQQTKVETFNTILNSIINYRFNEFKKSILSLINNDNLDSQKRNLVIVKLASTNTLSNNISNILLNSQIDLNLRKDLACKVSNGQNKKIHQFLINFYHNKNVLEELKAISIKCLKGSMSSNLVEPLKKVLLGAQTSTLKLETLMILAPYIHETKLARGLSLLIKDVNQPERQEIFNTLVSRPSKVAFEVLEKLLVNSQRSEAKSYIKTLISDSENLNIFIQKLILKQDKHSIQIMREINRTKSVKALNSLLDVNTLKSFNHKLMRETKRTIVRIGNLQTITLVKKINNENNTLISEQELSSYTNQIEQRSDVQLQRYHNYQALIAKLAQQEVSIEELQGIIDQTNRIITNKWNLHSFIPNYKFDAQVLMNNLVQISTVLNQYTISKESLKALYALLETISYSKKVESHIVDEYASKSNFVFSQLFNHKTQISLENVQNMLDGLNSESYSKSISGLMNYISLKSLIHITSYSKYRTLIDSKQAQEISQKLKKDLKDIIIDISSFHPSLDMLTNNDIQEILEGKNLFDPKNAQIISSSDLNNIPERQIRIKNDLKVSPGIYMCPTPSSCRLIVEGKFEMDPFSLIIANENKVKDQVYSPNLTIMATSFGNVYVDLSANHQKPNKPDKAASGTATTYKSVFSHNERYCRTRIYFLIGNACISHGTRPVYKTVVDKPATAGRPGKQGTQGNSAGNLRISYMLNSAGLNSIDGKIHFIANGAIGGNGGDGGDKAGGTIQGTKGNPGIGGNGGSLISEILIYDQNAASKLFLLSVPGEPGEIGAGTGASPRKIQGKAGVISAQDL